MTEQIITSSVLIAGILVLSIFLEKRMDPRIRYALWLVVAVKLLVPIPEFESAISVMNIVNRAEERSVQYFFEDSAVTGENESLSRTHDVGRTQERGEKENVLQGFDLADICHGVWIAGVLICTGVFLWSNLRFAKKLRRRRVKIGQVKGKLALYAAEGIQSPCLFGFFRPAIYLKKGDGLSEEQRELVIAHEYTHYRHGDHVWALVRCACVILYWYHPLVWLAAYRSVTDSELACDAGTLRIIGEEKRIEYGKTLIEAAKGIRAGSSGAGILGCSTGAAGGLREMKKRMRMIADRPRTKLVTVVVLILASVSIVGCTFGGAGKGAADTEITEAEEDTAANTTADAGKTERSADTETASEQENMVHDPDSTSYEGVLLRREAEADKVCIRVEPSELRDYLSYYYIPEDKDQEWLRNFMDTLPTEGMPYAGRWKGMKETGWQIVYQDQEFMVFEGGYLYYFYEDETEGEMEYFVEAPKLCDYIQILLLENLDYERFVPSDLKDIVSARLDACSISTGWELYSQTITDRETLELFEDWFGNAEYIYGGADCGNQNVCLELTLAGGETVRLSVAADSCSNFAINGVYYDYRPTRVWDNREFFACFDEIPWSWTEE